MLALPESKPQRSTSLVPHARGSNPQPRRAHHHEDLVPAFGRGFDEDFPVPSLLSGDPFSSMRQMMNQMSSMANRMFGQMEREFSQMHRAFEDPFFTSGGSGPKIVSRTYVEKRARGQGGQEMVEKYQSSSYGTYDSDGTRLAERKQSYTNNATGLEKHAHERNIGNKARKVIEERYRNNINRSDLYKNMTESDSHHFDSEWQSRSRAIGISNIASLPAPSGQVYNSSIRNYEPRNQNPDPRSGRYIDESRRGDYIPNNLRADYQPVRRRDIAPTIPAGREPLALPSSNPPARQAPRAHQPVRPRQGNVVPAA